MSGAYQNIMNVTPDEVVFNGVAFQYNAHPRLNARRLDQTV
jgi:hypothetical protein